MCLLTYRIQVHTLVKLREDSTKAVIQIVSTPAQPLFSILKRFYTTLVVNVMSWNKAYTIYPQSSFLHHKTYLLKEMNDHYGKLLAKHETRGWKSQDVLWREDEASHGSILQDRRVGDQWTWIIPFNNTGVDRSEMPDSVLEYSCFRLEKDLDSGLHFYECMVLNLCSLVLRYGYTNLTGDRVGSEFWAQFAGPRLERLSLIELLKVPQSSRPQDIQDAMDDSYDLYGLKSEIAKSGIELPSYDHEIPRWYAQWEKKQASRIR